MATTQTEIIAIKGNDTPANQGELQSQVFTSSERMGRAGKILAICWGLALITLFIPIAHFFLVPAFAIAGPITAFMKYKVEKVAEKAHGVCPVCSEEVNIPLDPADKIPKWTYCPACNNPLQLMYHTGSSV